MMKIRRRNIESDKLIEHGKRNGNYQTKWKTQILNIGM